MLSARWRNESHILGYTARGHFAELKNLDLSFMKYYSHWPWPGPRDCRFEILSFLRVVSTLWKTWCLATVCSRTENTGRGFKTLTILPEQVAWQWVICSLMWKLENWQTNLQEGNWISRETNGRPCGWIEFIRCKRMQGSRDPPSFPVCTEQGLIIYLFAGEKREFRGPGVYYQNGWIQYRAMMCSKWKPHL